MFKGHIEPTLASKPLNSLGWGLPMLPKTLIHSGKNHETSSLHIYFSRDPFLNLHDLTAFWQDPWRVGWHAKPAEVTRHAKSGAKVPGEGGGSPQQKWGIYLLDVTRIQSKDHHLFVASFLWSQIDTKTSFGSPFGLKCQLVWRSEMTFATWQLWHAREAPPKCDGDSFGLRFFVGYTERFYKSSRFPSLDVLGGHHHHRSKSFPTHSLFWYQRLTTRLLRRNVASKSVSRLET